MLKDEKGAYERIMKELTAKFNQLPNADKVELQNKLKTEAIEPTQDAIKVSAGLWTPANDIACVLRPLIILACNPSVTKYVLEGELAQ